MAEEATFMLHTQIAHTRISFHVLHIWETCVWYSTYMRMENGGQAKKRLPYARWKYLLPCCRAWYSVFRPLDLGLSTTMVFHADCIAEKKGKHFRMLKWMQTWLMISVGNKSSDRQHYLYTILGKWMFAPMQFISYGFPQSYADNKIWFRSSSGEILKWAWEEVMMKSARIRLHKY